MIRAEMLARIGEPDAVGCRHWSGAHHLRGPKGRPVARVNGARDYVARHLLGGLWRRGGMALHTCDHPWCVEISHLYRGDNSANMRDRAAAGRAPASHTLSGEIANRIRVLRRDTGLPFAAIGPLFECSESGARDASRGRTYAGSGVPPQQ